MARWYWLAVFGLVGALLLPSPAAAQQVHVTAPLVNTSSSFYEWYGINWGYRTRWRNGYFFFNRGGSLGTIPPFGGFDPSAAARFGFATRHGGGEFFFNFAAAQGSRRTITSSAPSVTLQNGTFGAFRDTTLRPFVIGLVPVVGGMSGGTWGGPAYAVPTYVSPLAERLSRLRAGQAAAQQAGPAPADGTLVLGGENSPPQRTPAAPRATRSSAERGDISVAEIRAQQQRRGEQQQEQLAALIAEAEAAEQVGRFGAARVRYKQAAARADGPLRDQLLARLAALADK